MTVEEFKDTGPAFLPEDYFNGRLEGWGVLESLTGGLQRRCTIKAEGHWDEATRRVTLNETYTFDDGHKDTLAWTITKQSDSKYSGTETRVEGEAVGEQAGCAFHWK